jgi:hypothetical protein
MGFRIRRSPGHRGVHVPHHPGKSAWRRDIAEFAALFVAAGIAHLFSTVLGHRASGPEMLVGLGGILIVIVSVHLWWTHRREHHRPGRTGDARDGGAQPSVSLWRVRARVRDTPGQLAAMAAATAATGGNIMSLSSQLDTDGTVDEIYVQMPSPVPAETLVTALTSAGGREVTARPATMHELVDPVTRALLLASAACANPQRLPVALATLLDAHLVSSSSSSDGDRGGRETLSLVASAGRPIRLRRPGVPFTASEIARALAMLDHARGAEHPCQA